MGCDVPAPPEHYEHLGHIDRCHKLQDRIADLPTSAFTIEMLAIASRLFLPPFSNDHLHKDGSDNVRDLKKLEAFLKRKKLI